MISSDDYSREMERIERKIAEDEQRQMIEMLVEKKVKEYLPMILGQYINGINIETILNGQSNKKLSSVIKDEIEKELS